MPWTLSHPAAVLPLRRLSPRPLNFAALVVGSMTPDIGYYINRFDLSDFAHTLPGSFIACLPTGVIMLFIFYLFSRPVCYALPSPHRQSLLPLCPDFPTGLTPWAIILLSLLIGAWTHNFWDAFTHETRLVCRAHPVAAAAGHAAGLPHRSCVSCPSGSKHGRRFRDRRSRLLVVVAAQASESFCCPRNRRMALPVLARDHRAVACHFRCRRLFTTRRRRLCTTFALVARLFSGLRFILRPSPSP